MRNLLLIVLSAVCIASCSTQRYVYTPSAHNVPVLTKKGDSKLSASYSTNLDFGNSDYASDNQYDRNSSNGVDLQGALAITNNLAIQASYYYRKEKNYGSDNYYSNFSNSS